MEQDDPVNEEGAETGSHRFRPPTSGTPPPATGIGMRIGRIRWRKVARWILVIAGIAAICLATLPVWLPWVLKPALGHLGLRFEKYERRGYAGFAVTRLQGAWDTTRLEAGRVEGAL